MLVLDELDLPVTAYPGYAAIACLPHDEAWVDPPVLTVPVGFVAGEDAAINAQVYTSTVSSGSATFTVLPTVQKIEIVSRGGVDYRPAVDVSDPQPGEFVFDYDASTVEVFGDFPPDATFEARTSDIEVAAANPLITAIAQLPDIFQRYELQGEVSLTTSFEGQPSATFELFCTWAQVDALKAELQPNKRKQFVLFGIGFEVASITITKEGLLTSPDRFAIIRVELKGKWESYLEQQIILDADADTLSVGSRTIRGNTTVGAIAEKVGARAVVPPHIIYAPRERNQEQTLSLEEAFTGQLRHNGLFADYNNPIAIQGIPLDGTTIHWVSFADVMSESLEISVSAYPRAIDYENAPIEWGNALAQPAPDKEDTQGDRANAKPEWRLKPPVREYVITGAASLAQPVGVVETKEVLKLNFDGGGPVREQKLVYTENGVTTQVVTNKWGFAGTSHQHVYSYNAVSDTWSASNLATLPWVQIEQTTQYYSYDSNTGYLGSVRLSGWRLARLKSESNNEALDAYKSWYKESNVAQKAKKLRLLKAYEYQRIPVMETTAYGTALMRSNYNDIPSAPTEEYELIQPKYKPDGSLNRVFNSDGAVEEFDVDGVPYYRLKLKEQVPGWTDPQYMTREYTLRSAYLSEPNPESTEKKPLPDLSTGECKESEKSIFVPSYKNRPKPLEQGQAGIIVTAVVEEAETFIDSEQLSNQLESGFARSAKDVSTTQNKGRPSEHTRLVPQYEKIDSSTETDPKDNLDPEKDKYQWRITTRDTADPLYIGDDRVLGDTLSYPFAASLDQALTGLRTDMDIQNAAGTETLSIDVTWLVGFGIRPGDRVNLEEHGLWRVLGVSRSLKIVAPGICETQNVNLDLGKLIPNPTINTRRVRIAEPEPNNGSGDSTQPKDQNGNTITDPRQLNPGRMLGNPNGV